MELVFNLRDYRLSFPGLVKKARKTWPRYPGTRTDQSQRWDTTFLPTVSPPPPVVANDLFRRASRIRYQRLLGLMGPRLQPFSSGRIRFLPRVPHEGTTKIKEVSRVRHAYKRPVSSSPALWPGVRSEIWVTEPRLTLRATAVTVTCTTMNIDVEEKELISFE